jgi:GGDEF domain-containing protein
MGLIQKAFNFLKDFSSLTKSSKEDLDKPKRSFLKEAENFLQTKSYPSVEVDIDLDEQPITQTEIATLGEFDPSTEKLADQLEKDELFTIQESDQILLKNQEDTDFIIDLDNLNEVENSESINPELIDDTAILEDWEKDALNDEILDSVSEEQIPTQEPSIQKSEENAREEVLENYIVLLETTKEILKSKSFEDYFQNLMYSLIGQVGIEILAIYSSKTSNFSELNLVCSEGVDLDDQIHFVRTDTLYDLLEASEDLVPVGSIDKLSLKEKEIYLVENTNAEYFFPIKVLGQFSGFVVLGKLISGDTYSETQKEFIRSLISVSSNYLSKILDFENLNTELTELNKILNTNSKITNFADRIYSCSNLDEIFDITSEFLTRDFNISKFSLFVLDTNISKYKIFASNILKAENFESIQIDINSKIIALISQMSAIYKLENLHKNEEVISIFPDHSDLILVPLLNMKKLVGFFSIHNTSIDLSSGLKQSLVSMTNIIAPIISNILIQNEKESLYKNPFNPLHYIIEKEIQISDNTNQPFTFIIVKILHINRILNILGINFYSEYTEFISKTISQSITNEDYISRIGQGKFALLLKNSNQEKSNHIIEKIKTQIVLFHNPSKDFKLSLQIYSLTYPVQTKEKRKFIEMMEET